MAENEGKLELGFNVDTGSLERGFRRAQKAGDQHLGSLEQRAEKASQRLSASMGAAAEKVAGSIKGMGVAFAGGLLGGFAISGASEIPNVIRDVTRSLAELKGEAAKAGVGVEQFQALEYAAKQSGVGIDALTDGLKEMQLRADEFVLTGKGSSAEAFERLGYSAEDLKRKLKDPVALFDQIINRLRQFDTAAQIRISDEIFGGTGGEQFVRFLDAGAKSLSELQREARNAGVIIDEHLVRKGAEVDKAFQKLSDTISARLKGGIVSAAEEFDSFAEKVQAFMNAAGNADFWKRFSEGYSSPDVSKIATDMDRARAELAKRLAAGERGPDKVDEDWFYRKPDYTPPKPEKKAGGGTTPGERFDQDILRTRDQIEALRAEEAALGKTAVEAERLRKEQELLTAARRAGVEVSPELRARIDGESRAYAQASAGLENARAKLEQVRELQQAVGDQAVDAIHGLVTGARSLNDTLADVLDNLIKMALQAAILGNGPLGGLFGTSGGGGIVGSLFGGFRAGGGDVQSGRSYIVGEKGPELFAPGKSGSIVSNDMLRSIRPPAVNVTAPQASAAPVVNFSPTLNIQGSSGSTAQNADLAKQVLGGLQGLVKQTIVEELRRQQRPNGAIYR